MAKRKRRPQRDKRRSATIAPWPVMSGLTDAKALMTQNRYAEAIYLLEKLDKDYPDRVDVLTVLAQGYEGGFNLAAYLATCIRLQRLLPDDPDTTLALAYAYLRNVYFAKARQAFGQFLAHWPNHAKAEAVRRQISELTEQVDKLLAAESLSGEDGYDIAAMHEEAQVLMAEGKFEESRQRAEKVLGRHPDFVPVLNNISQTYFIEDQPDKAIKSAERVLELDSENYHALANLTRFLYMRGRAAEANQMAERLKTTQSERSDIWVKKAEALSYLGDDRGVLEVVAKAEQAGILDSEFFADPFLYHLAAVAAMRLDQEDQARDYWQQALALSPGFTLAAENMLDLKNPPGERHAPWPFNLRYWISEEVVKDLQGRFRRNMSEQDMAQVMGDYVSQHPEFLTLVPALLDRGDPNGRQFAWYMATAAKTPEMLAALRDFALSKRGPDGMRLQAANMAAEAGLISGNVRMWMRGQWSEDLLLIGFEIHDEDEFDHSPDVEEWLTEATKALRANQPDKAEKLLTKALEVEPDMPDLLNNLAAAYAVRGDFEQAETMLRQIYERHPDYVYPVIGLARLHVRRKEIEPARELLKSILQSKRIHIDEFAELAKAQIELNLADNVPEGARTWFKMWADADPENPYLEDWRRRAGA